MFIERSKRLFLLSNWGLFSLLYRWYYGSILAIMSWNIICESFVYFLEAFFYQTFPFLYQTIFVILYYYSGSDTFQSFIFDIGFWVVHVSLIFYTIDRHQKLTGLINSTFYHYIFILEIYLTKLHYQFYFHPKWIKIFFYWTLNLVHINWHYNKNWVF